MPTVGVLAVNWLQGYVRLFTHNWRHVSLLQRREEKNAWKVRTK
jgi:hypothetical protein